MTARIVDAFQLEAVLGWSRSELAKKGVEPAVTRFAVALAVV